MKKYLMFYSIFHSPLFVLLKQIILLLCLPDMKLQLVVVIQSGTSLQGNRGHWTFALFSEYLCNSIDDRTGPLACL